MFAFAVVFVGAFAPIHVPSLCLSHLCCSGLGRSCPRVPSLCVWQGGRTSTRRGSNSRAAEPCLRSFSPLPQSPGARVWGGGGDSEAPLSSFFPLSRAKIHDGGVCARVYVHSSRRTADGAWSTTQTGSHVPKTAARFLLPAIFLLFRSFFALRERHATLPKFKRRASPLPRAQHQHVTDEMCITLPRRSLPLHVCHCFR